MNKEKNKSNKLPDGWEIKKLGEVLKFEYGKPLSDEKRLEAGKYPVYGANGIKGRSNIYYYDRKTIVVGRKGSAGEINLTEEKFWPLDVTYFVTFDDKKYDLLFLFHFLSVLDLHKLAKGVKPGINRNEVYELQTILPPLPEQQRIVAILDECFAAIDKAKENAEENLKNAKEIFESYLQGVFSRNHRLDGLNDFTDVNLNNQNKSVASAKSDRISDSDNDGWEVKLIENCFKLKSGDNLTSKDMNVGSYPVFGGNGIAGYHDKFNLSGSNVIIGRVGALCGNVRHITDNIWLTDNAFRVVDFKYDFDHSFLTYLLNFQDLRSYARQAAQPVISNSSLKDVVLIFPKSLEQQKAIVSQLDALRNETQMLEQIYQKKILYLEEMKKSILEKAFKGEL